jgi:hypothetical protein
MRKSVSTEGGAAGSTTATSALRREVPAASADRQRRGQ